jgi:WD40 repeat protein
VLGRGGSASSLYLTSVAGGWRAADHGLVQSPTWSADGRLVAATSTGGFVDVVDTRTGRRIWRAAGEGAAAWSASGVLAVHQNSTTIALYDAQGRERKELAGGAFAWSGDRLASLRSGVFELRPSPLAPPSVHVRLGAAQPDCDCAVVWVGANRVRVRTRDAWVGYDLASRRRLSGTQPFGTVWSASGVPAYTTFAAPTATLVRGTARVRTAPSCGGDDPFPSAQFVGRTNALVYQSGCLTPSADIYGVAPDGTALRRWTRTPTDELSPALSPDATRVAYSQQELATFCKGCPHDLWVTPGTRLTAHDYGDDAPFDDTPTFSPDGTQLAFVRSGPDERPALYVMPAGGGPQRSLGVVDVLGQIAWGAQGIAYATGAHPIEIRVVDPASGDVKTVATESRADVTAVACSPDGRLAYLAGSSIRIVGGRKITLAQRRVTGLAWSPDGTRLAYVADDANGYGEVWTIATDGTGARQVTRNLGVVGTLSWR